MRDVDIREHLHTFLAHYFQGDSTVIDELGICQGQVRVDVAVVNESLHGFEIKAAADTLTRLDRQIAYYSRVLDYAYLVATPNHLAVARDKTPLWWGIYEARIRGGQLELLRRWEAHPNPHLDVRALAELLWHHDVLGMLQQRGACRGVRGKPRRFAWDRLCEVYEVNEIRNAVRARLKERASA